MNYDLMEQLVSSSKAKMQTQGEFDPSLALDIAGEVIEEFSMDGLIDDDEDVEVLKAELVNRLQNLKIHTEE